MVGFLGAGVVDGCYNKAAVSGKSPTNRSYNETHLSGIIGLAYSHDLGQFNREDCENSAISITNCYNRGSIEGAGYNVHHGGVVGSLCNYNGAGYQMSNLYNTGAVTYSGNTQTHVGGIYGLNGWGAPYNAVTYENIFCTNVTTYSGCTYTTYMDRRTDGIVTEAELKNKINDLNGDSASGQKYFEEDRSNINNGYPVLYWENEQLDIPIYTAEQLQKIGSGEAVSINGKVYNFEMNKSYVLQNDIDLEGKNWTPIGSKEKPFSGTFEGNYHKIKNLYYRGNTIRSVGLFSINNGTIENVVLENVDINNTYNLSAGNQTGGIAGLSLNKISNCGIESGTVSASTSLISNGPPYNRNLLRTVW